MLDWKHLPKPLDESHTGPKKKWIDTGPPLAVALLSKDEALYCAGHRTVAGPAPTKLPKAVDWKPRKAGGGGYESHAVMLSATFGGVTVWCDSNHDVVAVTKAKGDG